MTQAEKRILSVCRAGGKVQLLPGSGGGRASLIPKVGTVSWVSRRLVEGLEEHGFLAKVTEIAGTFWVARNGKLPGEG
jgi:hypothetical protein